MKRLLALTATASATILAVAVIASGRTATRPASSTLTVTAQSTSFNTAGTGLGAVTTFTDDLFAHRKKVGRDQVTCIATGPATFLECYATDLLPGGQVESVGPFDPVHQTQAAWESAEERAPTATREERSKSRSSARPRAPTPTTLATEPRRERDNESTTSDLYHSADRA